MSSRIVVTLILSFIFLSGCSESHSIAVDSGVKKDAQMDSALDSHVDSSMDASSDASIYAQGCKVAQDCMLAFTTCCGSCGFPKQDELVAVLKTKVSEYQDSICEEGLICPSCAAAPQYAFHADCQENQCVVLTLSQSPITVCDSDEECKVRRGECCECVDGGPLVAINREKESDYQKLVCSSSQVCDECVPNYSPSFSWCGSDTKDGPKHCQLDVVGP